MFIFSGRNEIPYEGFQTNCIIFLKESLIIFLLCRCAKWLMSKVRMLVHCIDLQNTRASKSTCDNIILKKSVGLKQFANELEA